VELLEQLMPLGTGVKDLVREQDPELAQPVPQGPVGDLQLTGKLHLGDRPI
jgi:hypothetical protein